MMRRFLVILTVALALGAPCARADDIDTAAALPPEQALERLEALLEKAVGEQRAEDALRIRRHLGRLYVAAGNPYAALAHLEAVAEGAPESERGPDRLAYAEALLATARENIRRQGLGRAVQPFLRDAVTAAERTPKDGVDAGFLARRQLVLIEAHFLLDEQEPAATAWEVARADSQPADVKRTLYEWLARIRYAQQRWADAGAAFETAGNDLGAAASWDAARQPERSIPIYARRIAAEPSDAGVLAQALRGARYTGAHGALLEALSGIPTPEGAAGIELLLARVELLEAAGRAADALPLLRDAKTRDENDPRPCLQLGRMLILASDPQDEDAWDAAADAYIDAIRRAPDSSAAAEGLSWIASRDYARLWNTWRDARIPGRCIRVQEALVAAAEDDALAWMNLGNTLRVLGEHERALEAYARAVEANPFDPAVQSDRGLALSAAGREADALAAYEKSLALDSGHISGRQNAARLLWLQGDDDKAEAHLGAAVRTARAIGRSPGTYRFLLDRIWRTRRDPGLR